MSGTAGDLAVKIGVDGLPQFEAAFNQLEARLNTTAGKQRQFEQATLLVQRAQETGKISTERASEALAALERNYDKQVQVLQRTAVETDRASGVFGKAGQAVGSFGMQLQDATVQLQMGTNALTVLAQQGSQFLGVFGTGGAIAGAVLAIGAVAAGFLTAGENAEQAKKSAEDSFKGMAESAKAYGEVIKEINGLLLTSAQRSALAANTARDEARTRAEGLRGEAVQRNEGNTIELTAARRDLQKLEEYAARQDEVRRRLRAGGQMSPEGEAVTERGALFQARARVQGLEQDISRTSDKIGELGQSLERLRGRVGVDELGPTSRDPFGVQALRAEADKAVKIRQDYADRVERIQAQVTATRMDAAEGDRLIALAAKTRDEELAREDGSGAAGRRAERQAETAAKRARQVIEKNAEELQQSWDKFWDSADKRSEDRADKEADKRVEEARRKTEDALKKQQQQVERTTDDVVRYGSDLFADMFATTEGGWDRAWQNMGRTAKGILARIAAEAVIRPIVAPIITSVLGSAASGGGALTAAGQVAGGGAGGLSDILGLAGTGSSLSEALGFGSLTESLGLGSLSGVGGLLGTSLWTTSAGAMATTALPAGMAGPVAAASDLAGMGLGTSLGGLLGGVGAGFGAGTLLNSLVGGKSNGGMIGSAGGALAGAVIGSIVPGIGTLIGGLIGGSGGGLLGGLFGPNAPNPAGSVQLGTDANGKLIVQGSKSKNFDMGEALAGANSTVSGLNTALTTRGLTLNQGMDISQIHYGKDANKTDQQDLVRSLLSNITGGSSSVMSVIARELAKGAEASLETAFSDIDWVKGVYDPLNETKDSVSAFQQSVDAVMASFDGAKARAEQLGLATDGLVQKQLEQVFALQQQRAETIWGMDRGLDVRRMRAGGQNEAADLLTFDVAALGERAAYRANLESLGQSAEDVTRRMLVLEETLGAERLSIVQRYAEQTKQAEQQAASNATGVISSLAGYARSLSYGEQSPLGASEQLMMARNRFQTQRDAALGGDASALSGLQSYSQEYLGAARSLYGSGEGYASAFAQVAGALEKVGEISPDTLTASFFNQGLQTLGQTLSGELQALRSENALMRRELQQFTSRISRAG